MAKLRGTEQAIGISASLQKPKPQSPNYSNSKPDKDKSFLKRKGFKQKFNKKMEMGDDDSEALDIDFDDVDGTNELDANEVYNIFI
jgi:hypothetical protein